MSKKKKNKGANRTFAAKRTMNPPQGDPANQANKEGNATQEQDAKRRLGSFEGAGEHARTGNPGHE